MATKREWADAYLAQAHQDLIAARRLTGHAPSVLCMLLQMVFEKAAKGALLRSGQISISKARSSHKAASTLIQILKRHRKYLTTIGPGGSYQWKDVLPLVQELERSNPQLAQDGPQLEYPWEDSSDGSIRWPARDLPIVQRMDDPRDTSGPRLVRFAGQLCEQIDTLFG